MANRLLPHVAAGARTASASVPQVSFCASAPSTASAGTRRSCAAAENCGAEHLWWVSRIEGAEKFETQRSRTQACGGVGVVQYRRARIWVEYI